MHGLPGNFLSFLDQSRGPAGNGPLPVPGLALLVDINIASEVEDHLGRRAISRLNSMRGMAGINRALVFYRNDHGTRE